MTTEETEDPLQALPLMRKPGPREIPHPTTRSAGGPPLSRFAVEGRMPAAKPPMQVEA